MKALPSISVDGKGSVGIKEDQKKKTEKMRCKMCRDFRTDESPTTYEEAVRVYKQLPSLIGDKGQNAVAVQVYLRPLSEIDSKGERMVREISVIYMSKTNTGLKLGMKPWKRNMTMLKTGTIQRFKARAR